MAPKQPVEISRKKFILEALLDVSVNDHVTEAVDLKDAAMIGLIIPPLVTCNGDITLTLEVSHDGREGTFRPVYDADGTEFEIVVGATGGRAISTDDLAVLAAYRYVKIELDCAQAADAVFYFVLKG